MIGPNFMDEIDCSSFFDHIDDLLDFPNEEDIGTGLPNTDCNSLHDIWSTQSNSLPGSDSVFSNNSSSTTDLSTQIAVPYEDIVQLEWLSTFVEDSFSGGSLTMNKQESETSSSIMKDHSSHNQFQTSSPVSVLESSSSCSGEKTVLGSLETLTPGRRGRARSKRPRPATFNPRPPVQLVSPTSSVTETQPCLIAPNVSSDPPVQLVSPTSSVTETQQCLIARKVSSDSENYAESRLVIKISKQLNSEYKKKKKIKFSVPKASSDENRENRPVQAVRKCLHCEITKTPQWRAGPMGPKTLCNACGVRYKSGRLFPEYRPAASPTFAPSLHSNSHKKVIEMRNKNCEKSAMTGTETLMSDSSELIPNYNNLAMEHF